MWRHRLDTSGVAYSRAERHLRSAQIELAAAAANNPNSPRVATALSLLKEGEASLSLRKIEHSWHFINAARRDLTFAQSDNERSTAAALLLIESSKLPPWRRKGVEELLKDVVAPPPETLREALWLRDDYYENRYHRIEMQREQLRTTNVVAVTALVAIVVLSATAPEPIQTLLPNSPWHWRVLSIVLAFGVLGGTFSAARSITVKDLGAVIPELTLSRWITWARTLLGASLGLATYAFLLTGLISLSPNLAGAAAAAFAGGFSEQQLLKLMSTLGGTKAQADSQ
jgi:HEPN domain-containing protein